LVWTNDNEESREKDAADDIGNKPSFTSSWFTNSSIKALTFTHMSISG